MSIVSYSFKDLAEEVLSSASLPMTPAEIWAEAKRRGLDAKVASHGKTPWASLGARLYTDVRGASPRFAIHAGTPKRFALAKKTVGDAPGAQTKTGADVADAPRHTFIDCARMVLKTFANRRPMHYLDITRKALEQGWLHTNGKTPEATLYAQICTHIKQCREREETPLFVQLGKGMLALTEWQGKGFARAIRKHNASIREALRERLLRMSPEDFEALILRLFMEMGFERATQTPIRKDGGIDVRGTWEIAGGICQRYAIQVKRWRRNVQAPVVQNVRGSLKNGELGLIVTTSDFSKGAREEAKDDKKANPIALINGERLVELLIENGIGVKSESIEALELDDARLYANASL